eukprot:scaffold55144_cov78-Cyclotella_meneghiniana.AAC.1
MGRLAMYGGTMPHHHGVFDLGYNSFTRRPQRVYLRVGCGITRVTARNTKTRLDNKSQEWRNLRRFCLLLHFARREYQ